MPYTRDQLIEALKAADAAGDVASAQKLADALRTQTTEAPAFDVDTSPVAVVPRVYPNRFGGITNRNQKEIDLGKKGVAMDEPNKGPFTTEDYANLYYYSAGPEYSKKYIGKKVKDYFNYPGDPEKLVRLDNGSLQYLDLSQKKPRWKAVDPGIVQGLQSPEVRNNLIGETFGNISSTAGGALAAAPAGPLTALVVGATAGAASDTAARYAALKRGRDLGINEGLTDAELGQMAVGRGMTSLGTGILFGIPGGFTAKSRAADAALFGKNAGAISDNVDVALRESEGTVAATRELADRKLGERADELFDPSTAQRAGGIKGAQEPLDIEATIQAQHMAKATDAVSKEITNRQTRNKRILTQIWDAMFPELDAPLDRSAMGRTAQAGALRTGLEAPEMTYEREAAERLTQINAELDKIDNTVTPDSVLAVVRGEQGPHIEGNTLNPNSTKFYKLYEDLTEQQKTLNEATALAGRNVVVEFSDKNMLLPELRQLAARARRPSPGLENDEAAQLIDGIMQDIGDKGYLPWYKFDANYQRLGQLIENRSSGAVQRTDKSITVAELEQIRDIMDRAVSGPQSGVRSTLNGKITPVGAPDLLDYWQRRKDVTRLKHDIFDGKVVRTLMASSDPEKVLPQQFMNDLFPTEGAAYLKILVGHVKGDEEAMGALRSMMLKRYNAAVRPNGGEFSLDAHNQFMAQHKDQLEILFDGKAHKPFNVVGTLAQEVASANALGKARAEATKGAWYNILGKDSIRKDKSATEIINTVIDLKASPQQLRKFMQWADQSAPETAALIRKQALANFRAELLSGGSAPSEKAIRKLAAEGGRGERLTILLGKGGPQFKQDLLTLADATELVNRQGKSLGQPSADMFTTASRVVYGPLSRMQRFITGSKQFSRWMSAQRAYEVISDPQRLHRALTYGSTSPRADMIPTAIAMDIGALGHILFTDRAED